MKNTDDLESALNRFFGEGGSMSLGSGNLRLDATISPYQKTARLSLLNQGADISVRIMDEKYVEGEDGEREVILGIDQDGIDSNGPKILDYLSKLEEDLTSIDLHKGVGELNQLSYLVPKNQYGTFQTKLKLLGNLASIIKSRGKFTAKKLIQRVQEGIEYNNGLMTMINALGIYTYEGISNAVSALPQQSPEKIQYENAAKFYGMLGAKAGIVKLRGENVIKSMHDLGFLMGYENFTNKS